MCNRILDRAVKMMIRVWKSLFMENWLGTVYILWQILKKNGKKEKGREIIYLSNASNLPNVIRYLHPYPRWTEISKQGETKESFTKPEVLQEKQCYKNKQVKFKGVETTTNMLSDSIKTKLKTFKKENEKQRFEN